MKKSLFFIGMALLVASCEKDPDYDKLNDELVVYTDYDQTKEFDDYKTYFLPDSILEVKGHKVEYWKDENAKRLIAEVKQEMQSRGYQLTDKSNAELGLQMSYVSQTNIVISGGYFNGFWDYGYWGPWWGGWYYPYTVSYSYNTNTLLMEMIDLTQKADNDNGKEKHKLPIIWHSQSSGYQYSGLYNTQILTNAIHQAFEQSPYINSEK